MKKEFLIINGPNLNLLGKREPHIYGNLSLDDIKTHTEKKLSDFNIKIEWFQSNLEGEIIEKIHSALDEKHWALIINPGAYSHTSVAILDALKLLTFPIIEVHISNTNLREDFRQRKITAKASKAVLEGFGKDSYFMAIYSQLLESHDDV